MIGRSEADFGEEQEGGGDAEFGRVEEVLAMPVADRGAEEDLRRRGALGTTGGPPIPPFGV